MFDFKKLEAFCNVYEQRSFSKAAEVMLLSQPTISAHVQSLEKEAGVKLLDRMGRTVLPTPSGSVLYRHAIQAFSALRTARSEIDLLVGEIAGEIRLGASSIPSVFLLPKFVSGFAKKFEKVSFSLMVDDTQKIIRAVSEGNITLGVVGGREEHPELEFTELIDDELIIVAAPALLGSKNKKYYHLAEIAVLPWIMRDEGSGTRKAFEAGLLNAGYKPRSLNTIITVDSTQAAILYACAGLGITVTSRLAVMQQLKSGELYELVLDGLELPRKIYCVQNRRCEKMTVESGFIAYLIKQNHKLRDM